ncbi:MAG: basic amino acid/polyamine antiporter, family [Actinomycetota bacterium]|jgi:APA family basic amino acid/polyamine antiporter|nr:basic amino acid/polyamine antiporter, family [Actinomycetota bacterium]MDQ1666519.1 basic amino acid/polyamine antiporter, family [Actinomycetota bacterium]
MSETVAERSAPEADGPLTRVMGPKLLLFFIIGDILGAGVYALTGKVAGEVGGALWAPFLIAFVVAALTACSYVELVGKYPRAAGAALYTNRAFGIPFVTFIVAFAVMCSGITSASTSARAFGGDYLAEFVSLPVVLVAICFLVLLALVNFRGVSESVRANVVLTTVELSGLLVIIAIGVYAVLTGDGEPSRLTEVDTGGDGLIFGMLGGASLAFFALVGFEDSVNMAEEVHEPHRVFPKALLGGLAITGTIYVLVALTSSLLVDPATLEKSSGPLLEVVKAGGLEFPPKLFALIALLAVTNTALINMLMASRLVYGMSRERIIPSALGRVHRRRRTPWIAIIFTTVIGFGLVSTGKVQDLGDTTALLLLCVFAVVNVAVLVLRRETVDHEHFRAPTFVPVIGAVTCVVLATPVVGRDGSVYAIAGVLIGIGVLLWFVNRTFVGRQDDIDAERLAAAE